MSEAVLTFAKIVANPKDFSWSQVYSAGKLFAVLSLETEEDTGEKDYLNVLGKEIFDTLEQEFFTLETKDLESIKKAVETTSQKIPPEVTCSFVIGSVVNNILYLYILGNGRVSLKREGHLGNLLEIKDQKSDSLKVVSGYLQDADTVILQTKQFSDIISIGTLSEFMDNLNPSDAAENLAPLVHEKDEAGAAAILIGYKAAADTEGIEEAQTPTEEPKEEAVSEKEEIIEEEEEAPFYTPQVKQNRNLSEKIKPFLSVFSKLRMPKNFELNHSRKVVLTIVLIIFVVFIGSVIFAVNKQRSSQIQNTFQSVYPQALKKYDEGNSLMDLNQSLATDSFSQAKQLLLSGEAKLPKNSSEEKQVSDLLAKVNQALGATSVVTVAKTVDISTSPYLLAETKNSGLYFSQDSKYIYGVTSDGVFSLNPDGTNKKTIIQNGSSWQSIGGFANYFGNLYLLDKKQNQILKYIQSDSGYSEANYFPSGTSPDFSKAVSIAIDSSVYVLSSDGSVAKFTRGSASNFGFSGQSLSAPTKIFTDANTNNIYVLDNGAAKIVVFDKNGAYKTQYQGSFIKTAKDFDVQESNKKIYVLSGNKEYEIDLK